MVTSNHIHLLVLEEGAEGVLARSMQLIAGRTGQEYNQRKRRQGAFWEDRYHGTAIESGEHLRRCMAYIDLNMWRAGVVKHPVEWGSCGFHQIQEPPPRYRIIDRDRVAEVFGYRKGEELAQAQRDWIATSLAAGSTHEVQWSESLAIGSEYFIAAVREKLGLQAHFREVEYDNERHVLREPHSAYGRVFEPENVPLSPENTFFWNLSR